MTKTDLAIKKEISPIVQKAEKMEIATASHMNIAAEMLSRLNKALDKITTEKEKVTKPLNEAIKAERARWKPMETELEQGITIIRSKMSTYQTAEFNRQKAEEAAIAARVGEGKGKLKAETAVKKMDEVEKAASSVTADSGVVKFKTVQKLKIVNESKIPREWMSPDEGRILTALKQGASIAGCEIIEEQIPVNYR